MALLLLLAATVTRLFEAYQSLGYQDKRWFRLLLATVIIGSQLLGNALIRLIS